ncbi:MAG TPA: peptidoglycan bridge formation glycyltransferase FemA/FemB family protein [Spirochaetia bacterium]|nr:peptidoglycan bridge formation glycyltransferase FemA/FemB family protein [Spirochaetia bacterium]
MQRNPAFNQELRIYPIGIQELDSNEELLQTNFWARLKERFGWRSHPVRLELKNKTYPLLLLSRRLGPGFTLVYVPFGPPVPEPASGREELLIGIARGMEACRTEEGSSLLPAGTFVVRFDLPWSRVGLGEFPAPLRESRIFRKAPMDIQPTSTVLLDIRPEDEKILAGMKHKTRYNIRLALKKGVVVTDGGPEELDFWYALYRKTALRDRITIHSPDYYRTQFRLSREYKGRSPEYRLLLARHGGTVLAGIIVAFLDKKAWYLFGASGDEGRNLMPTYALQWKAVQLARERGCETYDFFGIPPSNDPGHPMHGLFQFKTGFGGTIINRPGCWDVVLGSLRYPLYVSAERVRSYYYRRLRKRNQP